MPFSISFLAAVIECFPNLETLDIHAMMQDNCELQQKSPMMVQQKELQKVKAGLKIFKKKLQKS
jgi:hypothetical protein